MVFFFYGPNSYASRQQLHKLIEAYLKKTGSDLGLERIDGQTVEMKKLMGNLLAVPFLASSRFVIVEYLSQNKKVAEHMSEVIKDIPTTTVAVFYEKEVDRRGRYYKTLAAETKAVEFKQLQPGELTSWIKREAKKLGATIEPNAVSELLARCGDDQWRLEQELMKLANYNPTITKTAVEELVVERVEESIFGLVEAVAEGKAELALQRYQRLLASGANELYILTMIMWQLRNLLLAKTAGEISPNQLAGDVGMSPFVATRALAMQKRFSEDQLKRAFLSGIDTEAKIKTGQGKADQLVELLIYEVASGKMESK